MTSKRRRARRYLRWRRYQARMDRLTAHQHPDTRIMMPVRTNQGFFRAEGWDTRGRHRQSLGHGS